MKLTSSVSKGRVVIPAALRAQLKMKDGDQLVWTIHDGSLMATVRRSQLVRAQVQFQKLVSRNSPSLADELIAERRESAAT